MYVCMYVIHTMYACMYVYVCVCVYITIFFNTMCVCYIIYKITYFILCNINLENYRCILYIIMLYHQFIT